MSKRKLGFDWDDGNRAKCQKHGVSLREIESVFARLVAILPDIDHSAAETRFRAVGRTDENRFVFLVFTRWISGAGSLIRPISARYMHRKEVEYYEKAVARITK